MYVSPHVPNFLFNNVARIPSVPDLVGCRVDGRRGHLVAASVHVDEMNKTGKIFKVAEVMLRDKKTIFCMHRKKLNKVYCVLMDIDCLGF